MSYVPSPVRYQSQPYRRCGRSGLVLPAVSLGLWQNFGGVGTLGTQRSILRRAFEKQRRHNVSAFSSANVAIACVSLRSSTGTVTTDRGSSLATATMLEPLRHKSACPSLGR
jgi:hypothetical protein